MSLMNDEHALTDQVQDLIDKFLLSSVKPQVDQPIREEALKGLCQWLECDLVFGG